MSDRELKNAAERVCNTYSKLSYVATAQGVTGKASLSRTAPPNVVSTHTMEPHAMLLFDPSLLVLQRLAKVAIGLGAHGS